MSETRYFAASQKLVTSELSDDESAPLTSSRSEISATRNSEKASMVSPLWNVKLAAATATTIAIGMLFHACHPGFEPISSLYMIMQIVTTVGYGDITPTTQEMKLCMAFYILLVLILVAYAVNLLSTWIISTSMEQLKEKVLIHEGERHGEIVAARRAPYIQLCIALGMFCCSVAVGTIFYRFSEHCSCSYGETWVDNATCLQSPAKVDFNTCSKSGGQVKTWIDAFYMSVVTATTVGFGDYTPQTRVGRLFGIFWMFLGVAATGYFISTLSGFLFAIDDKLDPEDALHIDKSLFDKIDKEGDGSLSRAEYYEFILVKHGLVTQDIMDLLHEKFDSFRGCDDKVTWEEMCRARRQMRHQLNVE